MYDRPPAERRSRTVAGEAEALSSDGARTRIREPAYTHVCMMV
jgi:hypothetical protein